MLLKDLERAEVPLQLHESRTGPMGEVNSLCFDCPVAEEFISLARSWELATVRLELSPTTFSLDNNHALSLTMAIPVVLY